MRNGKLKNSITYLFLVLFLSMKIAGLHALLHADDKDHVIHCTVCDHAITNNLTPTLTPHLEDFTIKNLLFTPRIKNIKNYNFVIVSNLASGQLFSRPPPSIL